MYLMLQDKPVMQFNIDESYYHVLDENLLPVRLRGIYQKDYPDLSNRKEYELYSGTLVDFLSHRVLSLSRHNAKKLLNAYNFSQSQDAFTKARIAIICKAVSMSDDYWINNDQLSFKWDKICIRKNHLNEIVSNIALTGSSLTIQGRPETPEFSTVGAYAKCWIRQNDTPYLLKAGSGKNEERIEVSVSKILDCFNIPHVHYDLYRYKDTKLVVSRCEIANSDKCSIVPAEEFCSYCNRIGLDFEETAKTIDPEMFYKTCIVDYLISNSDRHMRNWGFFMDNENGNLNCIHPVFDHNNAFDKEYMDDLEGGKSQLMNGFTQKEAAMIAMERCHFRCIKPVNKDDFSSEEQYESFMQRACELGLYKPIKLNIFDRIGKKDKYSPVEIDNNTKELPTKPFSLHNIDDFPKMEKEIDVYDWDEF